MTAATPEITFYTNHACPWAQRTQIALVELGLEYKEVIIDLEKPREPWYLEVNPRGLVPSISYNGTILTESQIVTQFLADAHGPSHLLPESTGSIDNAIFRARVAFFVDAVISKVLPHLFASQRAQGDEAKDKAAEEIVAAIAKEVEPLFDWDVKGERVFFGGRAKTTLAEVLTGPFVLRLLGLSKPEYGLISPKVLTLLPEQAPKFKAWADAVVALPSVTKNWDEKNTAIRTKARLEKLAQQAKV